MNDSSLPSFAGITPHGTDAVGRPVDRIEGPLKVSGRATYAYEYSGSGETAYGLIVGSTIAKGRIVSIGTTAAMQAQGVLMVLTHRDAVTPGKEENGVAPKPYLESDMIRYWGEPVALIVADSFEAARAAAPLVEVVYEESSGAFEIAPNLAGARKPDSLFGLFPTDSVIGDLDAAIAEAAATIDATYTTPHQMHNALEPHASLAVWEGDKLTLYTSHQITSRTAQIVAVTLDVPKENVRVIARYVGGGFGGKIRVEADAILAAMAARKVARPVKIAMTRPQTFVNVGHRPQSVQRVRLAAGRNGRLTGLGLDSTCQASTFDTFVEPNAWVVRSLYAAPNRLTTHRFVELDLPYGVSMRAPGEAVGLMAFESAIDELAHELKIDPIELRVLNEPMVDPESGKPFSTRRLVESMRVGARHFGWDRRPKIPASRREGDKLIGYGMAAAIRINFMVPNQVRIRLRPDGTAHVMTAATDIGTGTYTILAQIAADELGLRVADIHVEIGDSALPFSLGSGGSYGAAAAGSSVLLGCRALKAKLAEMAVSDPDSPLRGSNATEALLRGGAIVMGGRSESLADLLGRNAPDGVEADGASAPSPTAQNYSQHAYGAHFAEVEVDAETAEVRMRRMFGVFDAGRILNPKTARSQIVGGMIWGIGSALHEEAIVDPRIGTFANNDLASYHLAAHADVPDIDAIFLDGYDDKGNPLGIKGLGELGICGAGAAVANAVFNATGVRVRDFPITLDKLLPYLP